MTECSYDYSINWQIPIYLDSHLQLVDAVTGKESHTCVFLDNVGCDLNVVHILPSSAYKARIVGVEVEVP